MADPGTTVAVVLATLGGVVWAIRLEGRVNTQEKIAEVQSQTNQQDHNDLKERHKELKQLVQEVDAKIDRLVERFL